MLGWEEWMGWINEGVMVVGLIGFAVKKVMSIVQLISASEKIA